MSAVLIRFFSPGPGCSGHPCRAGEWVSNRNSVKLTWRGPRMGNSTISNRMSGFGAVAMLAGPCRMANWPEFGKNRAKISIEEPGVASCRQVRDNEMASVSQLNPYQCDQCGTTNIVAAPLLYQQGTRKYSGPFHSGTSQSYSAQAAAPPDPRGYGRPLLLWGIPICFTFFWGFAGLGGIIASSNSSATLENTVAILLLLGCVPRGNAPEFPQHRPL